MKLEDYKKRRKAFGITQKAVAEKVECSLPTIKRIENGSETVHAVYKAAYKNAIDTLIKCL
jgi:predicted transcriptional regulator